MWAQTERMTDGEKERVKEILTEDLIKHTLGHAQTASLHLCQIHKHIHSPSFREAVLHIADS